MWACHPYSIRKDIGDKSSEMFVNLWKKVLDKWLDNWRNQMTSTFINILQHNIGFSFLKSRVGIKFKIYVIIFSLFIKIHLVAQESVVQSAYCILNVLTFWPQMLYYQGFFKKLAYLKLNVILCTQWRYVSMKEHVYWEIYSPIPRCSSNAPWGSPTCSKVLITCKP